MSGWPGLERGTSEAPVSAISQQSSGASFAGSVQPRPPGCCEASTARRRSPDLAVFPTAGLLAFRNTNTDAGRPPVQTSAGSGDPRTASVFSVRRSAWERPPRTLRVQNRRRAAERPFPRRAWERVTCVPLLACQQCAAPGKRALPDKPAVAPGAPLLRKDAFYARDNFSNRFAT